METCDRDIECFYRHPTGEEGSQETRKRSLSGQQTNSENKSQKISNEEHFLYKKVKELEEKCQNLEGKRPEKKEESLPAGWKNPSWSTSVDAIPVFQPSGRVPSLQPQAQQIPSFQTTYATPAPGGSQWVQPQQPQMIFLQVPGVQQ